MIAIETATASAILARLRRALAPPQRPLHPFRIGAHIAGWLDDERAARCAGFPQVFAVDPAGVRFVPALADETSRSAAMADVAAALATEGLLTRWRNELYAVAPAFGEPPWFHLERAAARYFGVQTFAAHINGVVRGDARNDSAAAAGARMWFARRSEGKAIDPGKLDNLVGGGIAAGVSVNETLVKEAWEEAGIPAGLAAQAVPAGTVDIWREQPDGVQSETIHIADLWLPADFAPDNQDGEVVAHRLLTLDAAAGLITLSAGPDEVTADASLVVLDFLLRHNVIPAASPSFAGLSALRHPQAAARRA